MKRCFVDLEKLFECKNKLSMNMTFDEFLRLLDDEDILNYFFRWFDAKNSYPLDSDTYEVTVVSENPFISHLDYGFCDFHNKKWYSRVTGKEIDVLAFKEPTPVFSQTDSNFLWFDCAAETE